MPTAEFLWKEKNIVPFLKVDKGLEPEKDGVQMMKPIELESICKTAINKNVFGTKMRSVIRLANKEGIKAIVEQQFSFGKQIMAKGLIPILEPGKDIYEYDASIASIRHSTKLTPNMHLYYFSRGGH